MGTRSLGEVVMKEGTEPHITSLGLVNICQDKIGNHDHGKSLSRLRVYIARVVSALFKDFRI